jgi:hypothetical protein
MSIARALVKPFATSALIASLSLLTASAANAQSPAANTLAPASATPATAGQTAASPSPSAPYWALIGGYEWDTHGSSYGFVGPHFTHPFGDGNIAWTARVFGNYLTYEFSDLAKTTKVRSPGGSASVGLKFGTTNYLAVSAGPSVSWRHEEVTTNAGVVTKTDDTRTGVNFGGEASFNPAPPSNIQILGNYNTTDKYAWGRVGAKVQVTNRSWKDSTALFLGAEAIAQGNQDITSTQFGGLLEVNFVPSKLSLMFRSGYKRSTFDVGEAKTGPYFGIGLYKRF